MKFDNLKIAMVYGQGLEGCGVTRTAAEMEIWAAKNNVTADTFSMDEKLYVRGKFHNLKNAISFKLADFDSVIEKLNNYDIVMFMSYPHNKYEHNIIKEFNRLFNSIKSRKVLYIHEISKMNIDKITYLVPMLANADCVFHFSTDTWFSKTIDSLGIQKIGDRLHKYTLWMNFDELNEIRKKYPNDSKKKGIACVSRWSSLKNIGRSLDLMHTLYDRDITWDCEVRGVERSIGAKYDIIDRGDAIYHNVTGRIAKETQTTGRIHVYGPLPRNLGLDFVASRQFASSFFSLTKNPENYGDRMEYTQIEIVGVGTVPIFDENWAKNNRTLDGTYYYDIPYSAIYSNGKDIEQVADLVTKVSKDKELYNKYQNTSYDVVRNEFDADKIIPQTLELIMSLPRNPGKTLEEVLVPLAGREFYDEAVVLEKQGKIVAYGIQEIMMKELHYLDDVSAKQILHMKVGKKSKVPKVPKIKEPKLSKKQLREELASDRLEIQELKRDILKNEKIIVENGGTPRLSEEFVASVEDNNLQYSSWERFDKTLPTVQNCTAFIGDEKWLVVVRKRWGLKKKQFDTMDDASYAGLILVIEGAGYYKYAKGMWKEFDDIFSTTSYKNGNYSQSVLPRKFEPYFNKM